MFDVLDDLEVAIEKIAAAESMLDVERLSVLAERLEFQRLRAVSAFERSGEWAADGFVSTASALRAKTRCSHGQAHRSVQTARKLESLPETAAAFAAGEITGEHVSVLTARYTPERAEMLEGIEAELVDFAQISTPGEFRNALQTMVDAFDGDGGAGNDRKQDRLNQMTLSSTLGGRGMLNGSFDPELTDLALTALDAEIEALKIKGDRRQLPERRAEAFASICRQYLNSRGDSTARGRGQTHVSVVWDLAGFEGSDPEIAALFRADTAHGQRLSRATLERLTCDCMISRVIMNGPSQILDVGRLTRTVSGPLWTALVARDRHCTEPGCTRGPGLCEAHHIWHWEHGGPTNLANLRLGCHYHHKQWHIHDAQARAG